LRSRILLASTLALTLLAFVHPALGWSNGGFSTDPDNPAYGTHDWIAERALDWVPGNEKALILTYRATYLYGTELPDNNQAPDGIGDTGKHHIHYRSTGALQDDAAAVRAREMQNQASMALSTGDYALAAKWTGAMTHYVDDVGVFGHVMGSSTDWGNEHHHQDYEDHIQTLTKSSTAATIPLTFDGILAATAPYDAALALAHDTTFDDSGAGHTAVWMDQHYNWSDPIFTGRAYQSINLAVNLVAEAVNTVWSTVVTQQTTTTETVSVSTSFSVLDHVVINEFEQNPPGNERITGGEFVELYNPRGQAVDISGWSFYTTHGEIESYTVPARTVLPPAGFLVVTFQTQFLDNENESLVLINTLGEQVDHTPIKSDAADDARSWQRYPDGSENWIFAPSTAGAIDVPEQVSPAITVLMIFMLVLLTITQTRETKNRANAPDLSLEKSPRSGDCA
jgi:hypothetical protein